MADNLNCDVFAQERSNHLAMEMMSKSLLKALWREHSDKLQFAISKGRKVVRYHD